MQVKHITSACCRTGFPLRSKPAANASVMRIMVARISKFILIAFTSVAGFSLATGIYSFFIQSEMWIIEVWLGSIVALIITVFNGFILWIFSRLLIDGFSAYLKKSQYLIGLLSVLSIGALFIYATFSKIKGVRLVDFPNLVPYSFSK
jgi:hypothetical protein